MSAAQAHPQPRSSPGKGIVYMLAAVATLTVMDAGVKWLTDHYPVPQIGFMRYAIGILVAVGFALRLGGLPTLRTSRPGGHALRSVFNLGTMLTFYYALALLPLADSIAIGYAAPLIMTALSVPLLGERVVRGYIVPDPVEAHAVERIQELAAQGKSLRLIAEALDQEGVPTKRRASAWSKEAIRLILARIERGEARALRGAEPSDQEQST